MTKWAVALTSIMLLTSATGQADFRFSEEHYAQLDPAIRVGIEIEFSGVTLERTMKILQQHLGGEIAIEEHPYTLPIRDKNGVVEVRDIQMRKGKLRGSKLGKIILKPEPNDTSLIEDEGARSKMIYEIVTEPLTLEQVEPLQKALDALRAEGAVGITPKQPVSLQVNVEVSRGLRDQVEVTEILEMLRQYNTLPQRQQIEKHLNIPDVRRPFIQPLSDGFMRKVYDPSYRPTLQQFYDDYFYRQMWELMGAGPQAWRASIGHVKRQVLNYLQMGREDNAKLGEPFFRVVKFNRVKIASLLIWLFPNDSMSKFILETKWISAIPVLEFRERNNDFNVLEAVRMSVGFWNKARVSLGRLSSPCVAELLP